MKHIALIPAAGTGTRFGSDRPKQYTVIAGKSVLQHTIEKLLAAPEIRLALIILAPQDNWYPQLVRLPENLQHRTLTARCGGKERSDSVRQGLEYLWKNQIISDNDRILIHDAARCCLPQDALRRLIEQATPSPAGGILALKTSDTLKHSRDGRTIEHTVDRKGFWQAQTPQLFPAGLLRQALAADTGCPTDEAAAVERLGHPVLLVEGDSRNIKMTLPQDEHIVRLLLENP